MTRAAGQGSSSIVNAGENHLRAATPNHQMLIVQWVPARVPEMIQPTLGVTTVFVVSRDIYPGHFRANRAQWLRLFSPLVDSAIGDVTSKTHNICVEGIDTRRDFGRPPCPVTVIQVSNNKTTQGRPNRVPTLAEVTSVDTIRGTLIASKTPHNNKTETQATQPATTRERVGSAIPVRDKDTA